MPNTCVKTRAPAPTGAPAKTGGGRAAGLSAALLLLLPTLLLLLALTARADKLILYDGRVVEGCRVEKIEQHLYARFEHGTLRLDPRQIKEILYDSDEAYVPQNDYEREQLDKGFVLFEGMWMSRERRESILNKRRKEREAKILKARKHLQWENALRRETAHFILISNTSEDLIQKYCDIFEEFFTKFSKRWKIPGKYRAKAQKPVIKIYRNRDQYLASGVPARSAGIFFTMREELRLYHDAADPRYTLDVLFHEGTHLLLHLLRPDYLVPIWVNEGMAEYYGSSVIGKNGAVETGIIQEGRLAALRNAIDTGKYISLEQVLSTPQNKFGSLHYAEAWCLVHYLLEHDKYDSKYKSFFQGLITGTGYRESRFSAGKGRNMVTASLPETLGLFKKKMGAPTLDDLEREFLDYVLYGLPDVGMRGYVTSARIHMRDGEYDLGLEAIETALSLGSKDPNCRLYQGRIYAIKERYEEAVVAYQRAIELDPLNAYFHAELAGVLRESEDPTMMAEGIREYYLATEIAPEVSAFQSRLEKALAGSDMAAIRKKKMKRRGDKK